MHVITVYQHYRQTYGQLTMTIPCYAMLRMVKMAQFSVHDRQQISEFWALYSILTDRKLDKCYPVLLTVNITLFSIPVMYHVYITADVV